MVLATLNEDQDLRNCKVRFIPSSRESNGLFSIDNILWLSGLRRVMSPSLSGGRNLIFEDELEILITSFARSRMLISSALPTFITSLTSKLFRRHNIVVSILSSI